MRNQTVYFLKGLPASGKSFYAINKIEEDRHKGIITKRVNKDDLRAMLDNSVHSKEREAFVLTTRDFIVTEAIEQGYDVIVDDTNFAPKHKKRIQEIVNRFNGRSDRSVGLVEIFIDAPLQGCIERDSKREKPVGRKVIMDMYNRYLRDTEMASIEYDPNLPNCIIVDVDGTLASHENRRSPFEYWEAGEDRVNESVASLVNSLQQSNPNLVILIMTGRENLCDENGYTISDLTQNWLNNNFIPFNDIFIRNNGDHRPDHVVKKEMYENFVEGKYNVLYVIDDRKQVIDMWRSLGLTVLDVAGNEF